MTRSKIAFLGAGNMAGAIAAGLLAKGVAAGRLACLGGSGTSAATLALRTGMTLAPSLDALLADAGTLVLAFKPQHLAGSDPRLAELTEGRLVLSVLAGKTLSRLARAFPRARAIIRAMPNTPGQIGAGVTGWCALQPPAAADRALVGELLGALGEVLELPEAQMDAVTAVSGSGPAYVFEFAAALRDAGVAAGLDAPTALRLANATLLGAARLLAARGGEPEVLRDQVTSPNGTTFAGLQRMQARDFRGLLRETVLAAQRRAAELARDE